MLGQMNLKSKIEAGVAAASLLALCSYAGTVTNSFLIAEGAGVGVADNGSIFMDGTAAGPGR